jgi:hypothetical protein
MDFGNYTTGHGKEECYSTAHVNAHCTGELKFPVTVRNPGSFFASYDRLARSKIFPFKITVSILLYR